MNCTADVRADRCEIWAPTQFQTSTLARAAEITGLPKDRIVVHTTFLGGGFGRRSETDFVADAMQLSKAVGRPVKVIWSREDDIRNDFYHPASYHRMRAVLDADGWPVSWRHRIVAPSVLQRWYPKAVEGGLDGNAVSGADEDFRYAVPSYLADYALADVGVPVGWWRAVGHTQNCFPIESFVDELAAATGKDPVEFRRKLLVSAPRLLGVLNLAAEKAGWGSPLPAGRHRGVAVVEGFGSFVAEVAEVSVGDSGQVRVHRVVAAIDCGQTVNPDTVVAQVESAVIYGMTAALKGRVTLKNGAVAESNFHDYRMTRMNEAPAIEVYIVPSTEAPGGVGEPGTPPIAPAIANAVYAATGRRVRELPIRVEE
jgi:isoquinoline 1-oxidoreductase beta subunit